MTTQLVTLGALALLAVTIVSGGTAREGRAIAPGARAACVPQQPPCRTSGHHAGKAPGAGACGALGLRDPAPPGARLVESLA